jgi:hypothetical protein
MSNGGAAAAAAAAAIAQATKASGVIVRLTPENFRSVLDKMKDPLVVYAEGGLFSTKYEYLASYKGLAFYTKSSEPIPLPASVETVIAAKIWIP